VNYAKFNEEEKMLLMAYMKINQLKRENVWFLDSGCNNHMYGNKEWFFDLDEKFRQSVKLEDNLRMMVIGKGNGKHYINGLTQVITKVYFIPEVRNSPLSIGQLQEKNLAILIQHDMCKIYHSRRGLIIQTQMSANKMFVVLASVISPTSICLQATFEDNT
jgi:hypothetical protein